MTVKNDSSGEARQVISDSSAGNGAPGGHEAHGNFIDCVMKSVEDGAGSGFKQQFKGVREGVENQMEVVVGNKPKEHEAEKLAVATQSKGDSADKGSEAMAFIMNDEAKRAASGRGQALVFDNSIYPQPTETAKQGADDWLANAVNQKKAA